MTARDYHKPFDYHQPSYATAEAMAVLRGRFKDLLDDLLHHCPDSRERSLAITHLEDAQMRAIQAMALYSPGTKREHTHP